MKIERGGGKEEKKETEGFATHDLEFPRSFKVFFVFDVIVEGTTGLSECFKPSGFGHVPFSGSTEVRAVAGEPI